jgi:hypothetical protein
MLIFTNLYLVCKELGVAHVSLVCDYRLDNQGSIPGRDKFFFSLASVQTSWGPPNLLSSAYRVFFPGIKARPRRDADHSHPSSAEAENEQELDPSPPWHLHIGSGTALSEVYNFSRVTVVDQGLVLCWLWSFMRCTSSYWTRDVTQGENSFRFLRKAGILGGNKLGGRILNTDNYMDFQASRSARCFYIAVMVSALNFASPVKQVYGTNLSACCAAADH